MSLAFRTAAWFLRGSPDAAHQNSWCFIGPALRLKAAGKNVRGCGWPARGQLPLGPVFARENKVITIKPDRTEVQNTRLADLRQRTYRRPLCTIHSK